MKLFVYGTLLDGIAQGEAARLIEGIPAGVPASISGELRLIEEPLGCYPVLIPAEGRVRGKVIDGPDDPQWLIDVDAYEGADYRRWTVVAELADGSEVEVQAYICLIMEPGELPLVPDGDFARYLEETGQRAFG
jgi:gamma-glutamylcyclotransferase (GGCT)/AIG2-like uncharacterized protein YtfP